LVAGTNITITTDQDADSVTINAANTAASDSAAGVVELATTAETTTGTDATRAVTPDGLKDGYQGSANVTTLGTIGTGTWEGTTIASAYLDSDTAHLSGTQTFTGAKTFSAVVDITNTTDSSDATGNTGALQLAGGASIAKKLYVGTDLDVDGATTLDGTTINGTLTITGNAYIDYVGIDGKTITITGDTNDTCTITSTTHGETTITTVDTAGDDADLNFVADGNITLQTSGTKKVEIRGGTVSGAIDLYCENTSTPHYVRVTAPEHSAFSGNYTLTLPAITSTIATIDGDQTFAGKNKINKRQFAKTSSSVADAQGDIVYFGGETGTIAAGNIVHYNSSGNWEKADATDNTKSDGLLGVALGADADVNGVLLRGTVTLSTSAGGIGDILYLAINAGQVTATAPSSNNNIIRTIGYSLDASNGQIWFNPDSTFITYTTS
jgi:hypothetical protein